MSILTLRYSFFVMSNFGIYGTVAPSYSSLRLTAAKAIERPPPLASFALKNFVSGR